VIARRATRLATALAIPTLATIAGVGRAGPGLPTPPFDPAPALASVDRKMAEMDGEARADQQELASVGQQLATRHARVITRGRSFYRFTRAGLLPVGGGFDALVTHAMQVERARRLLASDIDDEARARGRAVKLGQELERIARDRAALASQRAAMEAAEAATQDEKRRQAEFDRAFQTPGSAASGYVPVYGSSAPSPEVTAGGFATARGRLLFPVVGRAEISSARRQGTEGPGLEIRAPAGSPVRAVFAGRVAFAETYGPYGRIVILDHGDHYHTVSGNLDEIDVKIGQDVGAGERIGTVGDDGRGSMLYFEVRHGSRTVPPQEWLGL
jgi:murein hydrolase activator